MSPDSFIGFTIVRLAHVLQRRMNDELQREVGISVRQFGALSYLASEPGIGSAALARRLLITAQSAGPLVDELARRGLVVRDSTAPAGIRKATSLTRTGHDSLRKGYVVAERQRVDIEAEIPVAEARALNESLLMVLDRVTKLQVASIPSEYMHEHPP